MRPVREQSLAGACHLFNIIPIWGLIFCGWIWYAMREESRFVVRHARQAMVFHSALLIGLTVWIALGLVARLLSVLSPSFSTVLNHLNDGIMLVFYLLFAATCLLGATRTYTGEPFRYPLVRMKS